MQIFVILNSLIKNVTMHKNNYDGKISCDFFVRFNPVIIELKSCKKCTPHVRLLEWKNISVQQPAQTLQTATRLIFRRSCGVYSCIFWVDLFVVCSGYP